MKLRHWIEILGNSVVIVAGLIIGLFVLIIFDGHGEKFVEPNLIILAGEALAAAAMVGLGSYHLITDWRRKNLWEILGDLAQIAFGGLSGWLFYQLWANDGLTIPYNIPLLWSGLGMSVALMWLGMNRLFDDLSKFPKVQNLIKEVKG